MATYLLFIESHFFSVPNLTPKNPVRQFEFAGPLGRVKGQEGVLTGFGTLPRVLFGQVSPMVCLKCFPP